MKIGVSLSNYGLLPSRSFLKDAALEIERLELDSIWVSDHIIVPKNEFISKLSWEGLQKIRERKEFIESMKNLRFHSSKSHLSDFMDAAKTYSDNLFDAYVDIIDQGLAPKQDSWGASILNIVQFAAPATGTLLGNFLKSQGIPLGDVAGDFTSNTLMSMTNGLVARRQFFGSEKLSQMIIDLI